MKKFVLIILTLLNVTTVFGNMPEMETCLTSPDGRYAFHLRRSAEAFVYHIDFCGQTVIKESEIGIELDNRLFESALGIPNDTSGLAWVERLRVSSIDTLEVDTIWHPLYGERSIVRDHYRQMTFHLTTGEAANRAADYDFDKRRFYSVDFIVRAYEEGVAFRFHFPEQSNGLFLNIVGELTQFCMPEGTVAWHQAWAQDKHSIVPLLKNNTRWEQEAERPLLLRLPSGLHVALLEAAMLDYARGKFRLAADNTLAISLYDGVEQMSPYNTPWRVVMAGERAVELINNKDLVLNLNEPSQHLIAKHPTLNFDFVKPGKVYRCGRLERDFILRGIRFAERMGFQFVELDARWYGPEMSMASSALDVSSERNFTIPEVCDSARSHGLGVWLYVNQRALYQQFDSILPLYQKWGVSGIKFGFVQVGNQMWSHWLHEAVRRCAEYGLMVDIHDEYRPTGISRTLPNLMTAEGICGQEEMPSAEHNVTLPFTRMLCGPADYTPTYYNKRKQATYAHQLAAAVVYYSPIQFLFWYDDPQLYDNLWPASDNLGELQFWHDLPTVFDESIALDGEPGEYIIQARRVGNDWFVGVMNGAKPRTITLSTDFLSESGLSQGVNPKGRYEVSIYCDALSLDTRSKVKTETLIIKKGKTISLQLEANGGAALHFIPLK